MEIIFNKVNEDFIRNLSNLNFTDEIREKYKFSKVFEQTIIINNRIARASEEQKLMYETKGCKSPILKLTREFLDVYNCAVNGGSLNDR